MKKSLIILLLAIALPALGYAQPSTLTKKTVESNRCASCNFSQNESCDNSSKSKTAEVTNVIGIDKIINSFENGLSDLPGILESNGYKSFGFISAEAMDAAYGSTFFCKNCSVSKQGKIQGYKPKKSSVVEMADYSGPRIIFTVFSQEDYNTQLAIIKKMGFEYQNSENGLDGYMRGQTWINCCEEGEDENDIIPFFVIYSLSSD